MFQSFALSLSRCSSNIHAKSTPCASTAVDFPCIFSSLLAQKSPLYSGFPACCIRGEYSIRGSTLIILSIRRTSHYDYNGITVPYWGRSEVVFPYPYSKALPPYMLLSVEPQHSTLLVNTLVRSIFQILHNVNLLIIDFCI